MTSKAYRPSPLSIARRLHVAPARCPDANVYIRSIPRSHDAWAFPAQPSTTNNVAAARRTIAPVSLGTVSEIARPGVSRHLRVLREATGRLAHRSGARKTRTKERDMTDDASPGARMLGSLRSADGAGVVRIEERYDTDVDDLWSAITDPVRLARWHGPVEGD